MINEGTPEYIKALYEHAINVIRAQDLVYAIRLLEKLVTFEDAFYTPFALSQLANAYRQIRREDLEIEAFRRVTRLDKDQQILLSPRWLAAAYLKANNKTSAGSLLREVLKLNPDDPHSQLALAEICLLDGNLGEALSLSKEVQARPEPNYQIVSRIIHAFALQLANKPGEAANDLSWLGNFLTSSRTVPPNTWDYRDIEPIVEHLGPNAQAAAALINVLSGRKSLQEFVQTWNELLPALQPHVTAPK